MQQSDVLNPPLQHRTREAVERVFAAGVQLLAEGDVDRVTVAEVARRAGVSVPAIYRRFGSRDELLVTLVDRALGTVEATMDQVFGAPDWARMSAREVVFAAVGATAEVCRHHDDLLRTLILRGPVDLRVRARGSASTRHLGELFMAALLGHRDAFAHPHPDLAAHMCYVMVNDALIRRVAFGPTFSVEREIDWDTFVREQAVMCAGYLLGPGAA